jgi:hypothetical protein
MIRNEAFHLCEWIEYHALVGIERVYLYDNNSTDEIRCVLCSYLMLDLVNYSVWPGRVVQLQAYQFVSGALRPLLGRIY